MPKKTRIEITGMKELLANLDKESRAMLRRVEDWFFDELLAIFNLSQERTPVLSGALKASAVLEPIKKIRPVGFLGIIRYTRDYAFEQHEVPFVHKIGQWKYLESAVEDRSQGMLERGARKVGI
jgi:hypothetical protein